MNIFTILEDIAAVKMYPKTHQIAQFFKIFSGVHAPELP